MVTRNNASIAATARLVVCVATFCFLAIYACMGCRAANVYVDSLDSPAPEAGALLADQSKHLKIVGDGSNVYSVTNRRVRESFSS